MNNTYEMPLYNGLIIKLYKFIIELKTIYCFSATELDDLFGITSDAIIKYYDTSESFTVTYNLKTTKYLTYSGIYKLLYKTNQVSCIYFIKCAQLTIADLIQKDKEFYKKELTNADYQLNMLNKYNI